MYGRPRRRLLLAALALAVSAWGVLQLPAPASSDRSTAAASNRITVAFAGDIALLGSPPSSLFAHVRGQLRRADVAIGNLEGTLSAGGGSKCKAGSTGCYAFQAPPRSAALLRGAGFDDLNVANNHAFDYGASGQQQTLRALAHYRLRWSGRPHQITVLRTHGVRVAILGFAPVSVGAKPARHSTRRRPSCGRPRREPMSSWRSFMPGAEGTDHQHVPHGTEYYLGENRGDERRFSHALIYAGADLVLASGPHVLRGLQLFHDKLIAYSLGNFATCSQALSMDGVLSQSGILVVTLDADGGLVSGRLLPVQIVGGEPRRVHGGSIVRRVNALSHSDFGGSAVLVAGNDELQLG